MAARVLVLKDCIEVIPIWLILLDVANLLTFVVFCADAIPEDLIL